MTSVMEVQTEGDHTVSKAKTQRRRAAQDRRREAQRRAWLTEPVPSSVPIAQRSEPFRANPEDVARDCGVDPGELAEGLAELQRAGWIERLDCDTWRLTIPEGVPLDDESETATAVGVEAL